MEHENCVTIGNNTFSLMILQVQVLKWKKCIKSICRWKFCRQITGRYRWKSIISV